MLTKYFSKAGNWFKLILLFTGLSFLTYCSSNNSVVSSFGKRKYTKGHFSDPVAKVKTDYMQGNPSISLAQQRIPQNNRTENSLPVKNASGFEKNNFGATANAKQPKDKSSIPFIAQNNNPESKNNVSLKENSTAEYEHPYEHGDHIYRQHGDSDHAETYMLTWILLVVAALVCILLLSTTAVGGIAAATNPVGVGCLLGGIFVLLIILALVFFILWIVAIAG